MEHSRFLILSKLLIVFSACFAATASDGGKEARWAAPDQRAGFDAAAQQRGAG
jgi:hypothetical protein